MSLLDSHIDIIEQGEQNLPITVKYLEELGFFNFPATIVNSLSLFINQKGDDKMSAVLVSDKDLCIIRTDIGHQWSLDTIRTRQELFKLCKYHKFI